MHCRRIWCRMCSAKNKETRTKLKCREWNEGLCAPPCFEVYHTKLDFWVSANTQMEKQNTQMSVNTTIVITELIFWVFSWWNNVDERVVDFVEGALWKNRLVRGPLYGCICFISPVHGKNKKHCLEMSINNCEFWKNCKTVSKKN